MTFTTRELQEIEIMTRKSMASHWEKAKNTFGVEAYKAFSEQEKLLKSLHLNVQGMLLERSEGGES
jgi:hypothetical protein|tara:strand:+ start:57 stop:254 length:198 start_codon:yes stop_codon:yes gene_type:complete